jgi:hypothetical protein
MRYEVSNFKNVVLFWVAECPFFVSCQHRCIIAY